MKSVKRVIFDILKLNVALTPVAIMNMTDQLGHKREDVSAEIHDGLFNNVYHLNHKLEMYLLDRMTIPV